VSSANRRRLVRSVRRVLREHGCTCTPWVRPLPAETVTQVGATTGVEVRHEWGCPLGDWVARLNALGVVPALHESERRCQR
jgi:hypothetical protein